MMGLEQGRIMSLLIRGRIILTQRQAQQIPEEMGLPLPLSIKAGGSLRRLIEESQSLGTFPVREG